MNSFESTYKLLNKEQKEAVDTIDGPLLVVAGPGTGKTQLLSARAANILRKTDSSPDNILALTYTEKAAQNMRERLLDIIGVDARKIVVKTFHGLGVELINSHPEYFWNAAQLRPAPEAVELEIMEDVLLKRPFDDPYALRFMGKFTMADRARQQISYAKRAGLTPSKLEAIAKHNVVFLTQLQEEWQELLDARMSKKILGQFEELYDRLESTNRESKPEMAPLHPIGEVMSQALKRALEQAEAEDSTKPMSEWKSEWTEKVGEHRSWKDIKRSERMIALSDVYGQFQDQMFSRGYYDFDDMILEVITQLESHDDFRAEVQERFTHIMIDEFQDTNDAQFRLAYLVATHPLQGGRPNIMAVGDDDQAIYRFQGAELSNIDNFTKSFEDTKELVLVKNYRSHQSVINVASRTAELIDFRLVDLRDDLNKTLQQANEGIQEGEIKHVRFANEPEQYVGVAEAAEEAFKAGEGTVAVLSRSHAALEQIAGVFHQRGVSVKYTKRNDILSHPTVRIIVEIAEVIEFIIKNNLTGVNSKIIDIVGHPMFNINPEILWSFGVSQRQKKSRQQQLDWLGDMLSADSDKLQAVAQWLLDLSTLAREEPAGVMVEYIIGLRPTTTYTSPLRDHYLSQESSEYIEALSAIHKLRSMVGEFAHDNRPSLADFVRFINLNIDHSVKITDESAFVSSERAIELLSIHSAKGLEFDHIFVIDATEKSWRPQGVRFRPPANLESMRPHGDNDDDYARLMFVALTRAKSNITVASYKQNEHGVEVLATPLVMNIEQEDATAKSSMIEVAQSLLRWPKPPQQSQKQLLMPILEDYELPVTHLLNFIDVTEGGPELFVERNLLRLPTIKTASMAYGTAIHAALERAQREVNQNQFTLGGVLSAFRDALIAEQLPIHDEERYLEHGTELLNSLFAEKRLTLKVGDQPERKISRILLQNGARISGKLDAVSVQRDAVVITDYKTGRGLSNLETTSMRDGAKALRHKLQLTFYALLARQSGLARPNQTVVGKMVYVESEDERSFEVSYTPTPDEIDQLGQLIGAVWGRIYRLDWPDIDNYDNSRSGIEKFMEDLVNEAN